LDNNPDFLMFRVRLNKKEIQEKERQQDLTNPIIGVTGITEGVIPFLDC